MQNVLRDGCKKMRPDWQTSEFYHICLSVCLCAIDLWSRSSFQVTRHAGFLSADVGKTINPVLKSHLLQTVIKLTFLQILDSFIWYEAVLLI